MTGEQCHITTLRVARAHTNVQNAQKTDLLLRAESEASEHPRCTLCEHSRCPTSNGSRRPSNLRRSQCQRDRPPNTSSRGEASRSKAGGSPPSRTAVRAGAETSEQRRGGPTQTSRRGLSHVKEPVPRRLTDTGAHLAPAPVGTTSAPRFDS